MKYLNITASGLIFLLASCAEPKLAVVIPVQKSVDEESSAVEKTEPRVASKPSIKPGVITGVDIGRLFTMKQTDKVHLVDCRPPIFYRMGHIGGAVNFPLKKYTSTLPTQQPFLDAAVKSGKVIVLYCQNVDCPDAYAVAKKLMRLGYSISIYKGGWEEWHQAGLE